MRVSEAKIQLSEPQNLYAKAHQAGKFTLQHMCGSIAEILPQLIEIGLDVYESVQPEAKNNNPYRLKKLYGKDITFEFESLRSINGQEQALSGSLSSAVSLHC